MSDRKDVSMKKLDENLDRLREDSAVLDAENYGVSATVLHQAEQELNGYSKEELLDRFPSLTRGLANKSREQIVRTMLEKRFPKHTGRSDTIENTESTYPKRGSTISGEAERLDACADAFEDLTKRADAVAKRVDAATCDAHGRSMCDDCNFGPDNTLTTPGVRHDTAYENQIVKFLRSQGINGVFERGTLYVSKGMKEKAVELIRKSLIGDPRNIEERSDAEARTDPPTSEAQRRFMRGAAEDPGGYGVSKKVANEFNEADPGGELPEHKSDSALTDGIDKLRALSEKDGSEEDRIRGNAKREREKQEREREEVRGDAQPRVTGQNRYEYTHGRKPRGEGNWYFMHKGGSLDGKLSQHRGSFSEAAKAAQRKGAEAGSYEVEVQT